MKHTDNKEIVFLDTHVHVYNCFNIKRFLRSTHENFLKQARKSGLNNKVCAVIFIADWAGESWYEKLFQLLQNSDLKQAEPEIGDWQFRKTREQTSFSVFRDDILELYIAAGRKIITLENLEVLALGIGEDIVPDEMALKDTVEKIKKIGGIPVVPWAFGKWFGKRGKVVEQLILSSSQDHFFLCDNGNRPFFWPWPKHFKLAQERGIKILSGSDPLHFSWEENRAGSFGAYIETYLDSEFPVKSLKESLLSETVQIKFYGQFESLIRFACHQTLMQVFKKKWKTKINL